MRATAAGGSLGRCLYSAKRAVLEPMAPLSQKPQWLDREPARWQTTVITDTVTEQQEWLGLKETAQQFSDSLDDIRTFDRRSLASAAEIRYPTTKEEVCQALREQLQGVNSIAGMLPRFSSTIYGAKGFEIVTDADFVVCGTARAEQQAADQWAQQVPGWQDLLARPQPRAARRRATTQSQAEAEAGSVSAVVKVKLAADLPIARGDTISSILANQEKLAALMPAFQQVIRLVDPWQTLLWM